MLQPNKIDEKLVEEVLYKKLPDYIKTHPEVKKFLEELLEKKADKKQTEDRFEKLLAELRAQREESEKKWWEMMEELRRMREESERRWQELKKESEKKWEESQRKWKELNEKSDKRWEATMKEIKKLSIKYDAGIGALGARWGLQGEEAFREAMKGILESDFPVKVERYLTKDVEGEVFGYPDQIELDLIIRDGEVIVAEIKSSVSKADLYAFDKKVKFYEKKAGRKVKRKVVISPMVDPRAKGVAEKLGIELYTYPDEVKFEK